MGKPDILSKLADKLRSVPASEEDVVYILSRVRKILETENYPEKYSVLNFYCNLALHTKIERVPKELAHEIRRVHDNLEYTHPFFGYPDLHKQLDGFIREHELPNFYELAGFRGKDFMDLLNSVYSDTPVFVSIVTKYKAVVNKDGSITGAILKDGEN
jgi:hypothetical protein